MFYVIRNNTDVIDKSDSWLDAVAVASRMPEIQPAERATVESLLRDSLFRAPVSFAIAAGHYQITDTPPQPAHATLGASSCERWWNCPASVRLSKGIPKRESGAASRGTAAHAVAETCLREGQDAESLIDRTVEGVVITPETAEAVQIYVDGCREWMHPGVMWGVETRGEVPAPYEGAPVAVSVVDFYALDALDRTLHVADFKHGRDPVTVHGNRQLRCGALALLYTNPHWWDYVDTINVAIYQPHAGGVKRDSFPVSELRDFEAGLRDAVARTQAPDSPASAGAWCRYCPAAGQCEEQARAAMASAQAEFDGVDCRLPEVRLLTPAERGAIWRAAPLIRQFLEAVGQAIEASPDGTGWRVAQRIGSRAWQNPDQAAQVLAAVYSIDPMTTPDVITPTEAVRRVADAIRPDHPTKKAATAAAAAQLEALIHRPVTGNVLVPDTPNPRTGDADGAEFEDLRHA